MKRFFIKYSVSFLVKEKGEKYKEFFLFFIRTREITDIFNIFDEIYLVFTSKKVNILYLFPLF